MSKCVYVFVSVYICIVLFSKNKCVIVAVVVLLT
jgi:hypothetical protein